VISEGSCDTEGWINDAENSALITGINYSLTYTHTENCGSLFLPQNKKQKKVKYVFLRIA